MLQITKIPESIIHRAISDYDSLICVAGEYGAKVIHRSECAVGNVIYSSFIKQDERKRVLDTSKAYGAYLPIEKATNIGFGSRIIRVKTC